MIGYRQKEWEKEISTIYRMTRCDTISIRLSVVARRPHTFYYMRNRIKHTHSQNTILEQLQNL